MSKRHIKVVLLDDDEADVYDDGKILDGREIVNLLVEYFEECDELINENEELNEEVFNLKKEIMELKQDMNRLRASNKDLRKELGLLAEYNQKPML